ncbi:MAG: undecaprenyl/decaprenyl-phosphate alpha-N-acetylglucosaminyl 1-phosphate transferase [Bacteroidetes bacterium]|nr:undecaprenyl/decaprenyl-phosphate alpha-N-acetylglucosaminyl 1-phosphate transferase [Bacteroidota bacterium]
MEEKLYLILTYSLFFLSTAFLSFLINGLFLKFSTSLGIRNPSDTIIRWSPQAKPSFGGISFYLIFLLSVACYPIFFEQNKFLFNKQLLGILGASTLAFLLGLSDDAYDTKPFLKLIVQIGCAVILIGTGTYIKIFSFNSINYIFTFFWIIGLMNSINLLDNMDAIATLVSIAVIMSALFILYLNSGGDNIHIFLLIGIMSALIGFLFFNWHPSKIFMGDTGSQFLGLFLAAMGILYFWNTPDVHGKLIRSKQFFVTILTFAIPIIDTTAVVINRILNGKSPFIGGKDHTTHSLFYMGITEKRIAILYVCICIGSMFLNYLIIERIENWGNLHIILFSIYFLLLFWFLYAPTRKLGKP